MKAISPQDALACVNCHYYHQHSDELGDCHRYPPTYAGSDTPNQWHRWKHPLVHHENWCGEFKPRQTN
jgi:hypothetical protein